MLHKKIILFGADGFGGLMTLASKALDIGIEQIILFVNEAKFYGPSLKKLQTECRIKDKKECKQESLIVKELHDGIFDPNAILAIIKKQQCNLNNCYFLCIYDNLMFSFIDAMRSLSEVTGENLPDYLPLEAIELARIKPAARKKWAEYDESLAVHCEIVREDGSVENVTHSKKHGFDAAENHKRIVKPIAGAGSVGIERAEGQKEIQDSANKVRKLLVKETNNSFESNRLGYDIFRDVLVEEKLEGDEFTIDGYIYKGDIRFVVQHKELRYESPFHGDGFVVTPPMHDSFHEGCGDIFGPILNILDGHILNSKVLKSNNCARSMSDFRELIIKALKAIGLENWVFHAEAIDTTEGIKLIELNPRVPGGLLAFSAGEQLGSDLFTVLLTILIGQKPGAMTIKDKKITAHIPLYASKLGTVKEFKSFNEACTESKQVCHYVDVSFGLEITDLNKENYAGFMIVESDSYPSLREISEQIIKQVEVGYGDSNG